MKLSQLVPHSSQWLGIPKPTVDQVAKYLRSVGMISSGGRGPGGAEMTADDKINLLLGCCGVEVASRAAEHVRIWRRLVRHTPKLKGPFAFTESQTVHDFFVDLVTKDLSGGPLDGWLRERESHEITLDFMVDEFSFTVLVSRVDLSKHGSSSADTIEVTFAQPAPAGVDGHEFVYGQRDQGYAAGSRLIRRLDARNIRGWGTCLVD